SGGSQSAVDGTAFVSPLKALVKDAYGNPVPGAMVTFTAPSVEPTITFNGSGGPHVVMVTTDANGIATSPSMTAGLMIGMVTVTASTSGATTNATFMLTIVAGDAERLGFVLQPMPTPMAAGTNFTVTVQLEDHNSQPVHMSVAVTLQLISGTLTGNATVNTDGTTGLAMFP